MSDVTRKYRVGPEVRTGDISEEQFKKEFKFSMINYNENGYTQKERQNILNYTYDGLLDLKDVLSVPSNLFPLLTEDEKRGNITFGISDKSQTAFVVNKSGHIAHNWFKYLDKYLGLLENVNGCLSDNVQNIGNSSIVQQIKEVLQLLKKKTMNIDFNNTEIAETYRNQLDEILERMPMKENASLDDIMTVEDSRERFIQDLTEEKMFEMFQTFNKFGVPLGNLRNEIYQVFEKLNQERIKIERSSQSVLVDTEFFKTIKRKFGESNLNSELISCAFEVYVDSKLKNMGRSNNYVTGFLSERGIEVSSNERFSLFETMEKFLNNLLPILIDMICINSDIDDDEFKEETDSEKIERVKKIEESLADDKGKFKLTYFKQRAKDDGFKIDLNKTERGVGSCYYITMTKGYIAYVRIPMYSHPKDKHHIISVHCGVDGKTKFEYTWDGSLNYDALFEFLNKIEVENGAIQNSGIEKDNESKIETKETEKFRLDDFKNLCIKFKLPVNKTKTPETNGKYVIDFGNKNYIISVKVPILYNIKEGINQAEIKTLCEEVIYNWQGSMTDSCLEKFVMYLKHISDTGINQIKVDAQKLKDEQKRVIEKAKQTQKEYNAQKKNSSSIESVKIETKKDLRDILQKYSETFVKKNKLNRYTSLPNLVNSINNKVSQNMGIEYNILFDKLSDKDIQGNSKSWVLRDGALYISNKTSTQKQIEGVIEGTVTALLLNDTNNKNKKMISEGVIYMICKLYGLDVRTYCNDINFDKLLMKSPESRQNYIKQCKKMYDCLINIFIYS